MTAPDTSRVYVAVENTRALYNDAPSLAEEYVAQCAAAHARAADIAERDVAIARYHHEVHVAALAAYAALKAADTGGGT